MGIVQERTGDLLTRLHGLWGADRVRAAGKQTAQVFYDGVVVYPAASTVSGIYLTVPMNPTHLLPAVVDCDGAWAVLDLPIRSEMDYGRAAALIEAGAARHERTVWPMAQALPWPPSHVLPRWWTLVQDADGRPVTVLAQGDRDGRLLSGR